VDNLVIVTTSGGTRYYHKYGCSLIDSQNFFFASDLNTATDNDAIACSRCTSTY